MRIGYNLDADTGTTYAYTTYDDGVGVDGINDFIAFELSERGYLNDTACRPKHFVAHSRAYGPDQFDEGTGREVARDKLLMKYYQHGADVLDQYIAGLEKELERAKRAKEFAEHKRDNAEDRVKAHM